MQNKHIQHFLDSHNVHYQTIHHSPAYTSQETAASAHVSGNDMAKSVIIKVDGNLAMVVLPASKRVNLNLLKKLLGAKKVELAYEHEFEKRFPDCEVGAMPPLGNLYEMEVFVDAILTEDEDIVFNAGTHSELIKMNYVDYARLVKPKVFDIH